MLACGPTAVLSHHTAARRHGLSLPGSSRVHITVPGRRCRLQPGLLPHAGTVTRNEVRIIEGLRVTSPARTLQDCRPFLDRGHLRGLHNEAQVLRLIPPELEQKGVTKREAERRLRALLERAGLQPTRFNAPVAGNEVDVLFAPQKLILEFDSWTFHRTGRAFERDRVRDAKHAALGYRTLRVTWRSLTEEPELLIARLAAARTLSRSHLEAPAEVPRRL